MTADPAPTLLTLPYELRNEIYQNIFDRMLPDYLGILNRPATKQPIATALQLSPNAAPTPDIHSSNADLCILLTCRQIHLEASQLALSKTIFHVYGEAAKPERFARATEPLSFAQQGALRHVTLTGRIAHLRAMNETWGGLPFGHAGLDLDTLTVVPRKVDATWSAYEEVADLSQSHTLAYILAETIKRLRNVRVIHVRNEGCFNEAVWKLVYRSLVYRMWRWGGEKCGVRFEYARENDREEWFCIWLRGDCEEAGREVGDEVIRLVGRVDNIPELNLPGW